VSGVYPAGSKALDAGVLFERFFESSPDSIVVTDEHGCITRANAQTEKLFGYKRDELLGRPVEILIPERLRPSHPSNRENYSAHPRIRPMGAGLELFGQRKDGSEFPVDIMLSPIETAEGQLVLAVVRDISDWKLANEALHRSEEQFHSLIEGVRDYAIFLLDPDGKVATWNSGALRIKGYSAEEILGQHFSRFYTPEDVQRDKPRETLRIAADKGRFEDEGWRVRKDGSRFWASAVITAIRDKDSRLVGFSKVTRDLSDRKRADEALLHELSKVFFANLEVRKLLVAISASLQQIAPHDYATLALHQSGSDAMREYALQSDSQDQALSERVISIDDSPAGETFRTQRAIVLSPIESSNYAANELKPLVAAGLKSGCWLPLSSGERAVGVLMIGCQRLDAFSERELEMLLPLARQIATAIDSSLAHQQIAEEAKRLSAEKEYLEEELTTEHGFEDIIGEGTGLKRVLRQVETVAPTEATVLILGETGTGKELIARAIHRLSNRHRRTFVKLNCAAIPSGLLESELFGYERGAFTGAISQKVGRLELADQGTLFLDEIGDLPLELQPKLLRALQEKEVERLGSTRTIPVDVRLIAATNRDLAQMVSDRQFRSDLYYRLRVFPISLPPLRERRDDIPLLVSFFVQNHARRLGKRIETIPPETMRAFVRWDWPGNIRELENFIERAVILTNGPVLRAPLSELELERQEDDKSASGTLETAEREHILRVLREAKGMIGGPDGAAARLGLKRTTLNSKLKKLGITHADYISSS
jgi:PAS domain S-box-containing protein